MGVANVQMAIGPAKNPVAVINLSTTVTIPANAAVIIDASNIMDNAGVKNQIAVTLPTDTTNPSVIIGVTRTSIPPLESGVIEAVGPLVLGIADGAITGGTTVDNSVTSTKTHCIKTHTGGKMSLGIAACTAADTETIPFFLCFSINA